MRFSLLLISSQQFFSHVCMGPPGLNQYKAADKKSCSRTQHSYSASGETQTSNRSIPSLILYQLTTVLCIYLDEELFLSHLNRFPYVWHSVHVFVTKNIFSILGLSIHLPKSSYFSATELDYGSLTNWFWAVVDMSTTSPQVMGTESKHWAGSQPYTLRKSLTPLYKQEPSGSK